MEGWKDAVPCGPLPAQDIQAVAQGWSCCRGSAAALCSAGWSPCRHSPGEDMPTDSRVWALDLAAPAECGLQL